MSNSAGHAKRHATDHTGDVSVDTKRRKRVFSCESCQRLKCRCDYDPKAKACRRCQNLRIVCSKKDDCGLPELISSGESESIENRLRKTEEALTEIRRSMHALSSRIDQTSSPRHTSPRVHGPGLTSPSPVAYQSGSESLSDPTDHAINSAPVVVLREIGKKYAGSRKKTLRPAGTDLVSAGLLDEQSSNELIEVLSKSPLLAREKRDFNPEIVLRDKSPFLHSIYCLHAISYKSNAFGTSTNRGIYEHVRLSLGQLLLSSPSTLEDIQGILLMSENLNTGIQDGIEYIDSWVLTGYAAQKALLSISFSEIVESIKKGAPASHHSKTIRLWSNICLHHLHWAAATGRPSTIPQAYLNHCKILLSFYDASIEDSMILAEISLYEMLLQRLDKRLSPNSDGDFASWKQDWSHLLSLPTASILKIGYHCACLIFAIRWLEDLGERLCSTTFLSDQPLASASIPSLNQVQDTEKGTRIVALRTHALKNARAILEKFLHMPTFLRDALASIKFLCLAYSALILAHYQDAQSELTEKHNVDLLTRLEEWFDTSPGKSAVAKFVTMAKQRLEARRAARSLDLNSSERTTNLRTLRNLAPEQLIPTPISASTAEEDEISMAQQESNSLWSVASAADYDFPNMEGFFSGGFLGFDLEG